ncbi:hypothetical protein [Amycolatopsis sp. cmx-11-12]|uniref:hypothetical protein n=1 Tax=Amycolatopsis sp. cmx-11-12 TaxID=2785795 RepID=UPI003917302E
MAVGSGVQPGPADVRGVEGENHNGEQFNHEQTRTDDIIARLAKVEELLANKNLASIPQWQWDRVLNRVLQMSAGVEGENHNGEQFNHEQARVDDIIARLTKIESKLPAS